MYLVLIILLAIAVIAIIALTLNVRKKDRQLIEVLNEKSLSKQSLEERIENLLRHIDYLDTKYIEDTDYLRERLSWTEEDLRDAREALQKALAEKDEILASNMAAEIAQQFVADSMAELRRYELAGKTAYASFICLDALPVHVTAHE